MKKVWSKLMEKIIAHKVRAIALSAAAVVTVSGAVAGAVILTKNHDRMEQAPAVSEPSETEPVEVADEATEPETTEEEVAPASEPEADTTSDVTSVASTTETASSTPTQTAATASESTASTDTSTTTDTTSSTTTRKFVQLADTETGISWDGVSPILYTYPDGTTGYEKRDGATYEQVPGLIDTVNLAAENYVTDYDGYCKICGKKGWDGTNGTCAKFLRAINCPNCGEYVEANTCHTCGE